MSENFIHKTIHTYNIQKFVKHKLIRFRPVQITRSVTDVL